jgi:tetratricopeptide (TPR) repeat protein
MEKTRRSKTLQWKKTMEMTIRNKPMQTLRTWLAFLLAALLFAQTHLWAQDTTGKIHGHVQDPMGLPMAYAEVAVTADGKATKYTFVTDAKGDYKGDNIPPGTYILRLETAEKALQGMFFKAAVTPGSDTRYDFDLSLPDYVSKFDARTEEQLEDLKAKNAAIQKENAKIKDLNADLLKARQDNKDRNYVEAEALMVAATRAKPDGFLLWAELGVAQKGLKKYDDAAASLKMAVELDVASQPTNLYAEATANDALGEVYAALGKMPEAQTAYEAAAKEDPKNASMHYSNEAVILSGLHQPAVTVAAADKAIAADPKRAIAYYLKAQALTAEATVDPKTGKVIAPPGCVEAYKTYLELAPNGSYAADVKAILAAFNASSSKVGKE